MKRMPCSFSQPYAALRRARSFGIRQALEKAEGTTLLAGEFIVFFVNDGRDASHGFPVPESEKKLAACCFPEGMLSRRQECPVIGFEIGHPQRGVRIDLPGKADEPVEVSRGADLDDFKRHRPSSL